MRELRSTRAFAHGAGQNAHVPREVVLHVPPSEHAPQVAQPALRELAARALRLDARRIAAARLRRLSFDARARERRWRLVVDVWIDGEPLPPAPASEPPTHARPKADAPHVLIVGSGPAGLFAALDCLAAGLRTSVIERGQDVQTRRRSIAAANRGLPIDPESNYAFGEGGAGTYSDGKLYTRSGDREQVRGVLELLHAHGAPEEILASWRPHIGSNRLPEVVAALRETIRRSGGSIEFGTCAQRIETAAGAAGRARVVAVHTLRQADGAQQRIACDALVLACGHSALDSLRMAAQAGAALQPKGFAVGLRIEHQQAWLDQRQYGGLRESCELPASFYELRTQVEGRGVYSFCMCPGGFIVPASSDPQALVVNGMSLARRDSPYANSGLVVQLEPEDWCGELGVQWGFDELLRAAARLRPEGFLAERADGSLPQSPEQDPLCGARLQLALETLAAQAGGGGNRAPAERADRFAQEQSGALAPSLPTSYRPGVSASSLRSWLPPGLALRLRAGVRAFDAQLPGFAAEHGQLIGVETRTSSPVRIARDAHTCESPQLAGLYPCGEGAGYAGGIVSAALDGRRVAAALARALHGA
jgi:uncharacterized FAD-dependent dehydrogenase